MRKIWNFAMAAIVIVASAGLFTACDKDDVGTDNPTEDVEKLKRAKEYGRWIDGVVGQQMIDQLDYLFQASAYRDSLRNGGDTEVVMKRQFSNPNMRPPQFDENGEIYYWQYVSENFITHNGISLDKDGAEWTVHSYMRRFWYAPSQPEQVDCQWTVSRNNGVYTLSGGMIHNGLWEEYFTLTEISDVKFTTGLVSINMFPYGEGIKRTRRYCFDGNINITTEKNKGSRPNTNINITLNSLNGYNSKPYNRDGEPVFLPDRVYFTSGSFNASVYDGKEPLHIVADFSKSEIKYLDL